MRAVEPTAGPDPATVDAAALLDVAATAIHAERDASRLADWVLTRVLAVAGADATGLWQLDRGGMTWAVAGSPHLDPTILGDLRMWPALAAALDDGITAAGPDVGRLFGGAAVTVVPLPFPADGPRRGALVLISRTPGGADADPVVVALARHLAVALDNLAALNRLSDLEASQRSVVRQLQEAVFTPAPTVPHTELGMHYVASDETAPTGGDLYDWVVLPDGHLHVAVVDIMGKGVAATKDALTVTHALRLLVLDGCPLETLVSRADELALAHDPDLVATVIVGRYDPDTGVLRLAGGGHPPPLLITDGKVEEIAAPGIPIGFPDAGSSAVAEIKLDRSDTVVLYTDGLIESTKDIVKGLEDLTRYARETSSYPAPNLARALVERALRGVTRHDDSLALVLRRRSPPPQTGMLPLGPFEHRFTPSTAGVTIARHLLGDWLVRVPVEGRAADDILLMTGELCANAVYHASGRPGSVVLRAWSNESDVVVEVEDDGGDFQWPERLEDLPDVESEQGRGLFLVESLSDDLTTESWPGHTAVRVVKRAVIGAG